MKGYLFIFHKNHILSSLPFLKDIFFSKVPYSFFFFFWGGVCFFPLSSKRFCLNSAPYWFLSLFSPQFFLFSFYEEVFIYSSKDGLSSSIKIYWLIDWFYHIFPKNFQIDIPPSLLGAGEVKWKIYILLRWIFCLFTFFTGANEGPFILTLTLCPPPPPKKRDN